MERKQGAGPKAAEQTVKVTVILTNRQVVFLDRLAADVREKCGAALQRAEVIRALVDALAESRLDLSAVDLTDPDTRESNLKALFAARLKR
jgi:3-methyladenine DNA glycosylase/8-oxoguanine DNA glycosylase